MGKNAKTDDSPKKRSKIKTAAAGLAAVAISVAGFAAIRARKTAVR